MYPTILCSLACPIPPVCLSSALPGVKCQIKSSLGLGYHLGVGRSVGREENIMDGKGYFGVRSFAWLAGWLGENFL